MSKTATSDPKPDELDAVTTTKVTKRRARQVAALAKLAGQNVEEMWEELAGKAIDERLSRALAAQKK